MRSIIVALLATLTTANVADAQGLGPQGGEIGHDREQVWRIPSADASRSMLTTVFRPPGEQRRPLVILNHGSQVNGRDQLRRPRFPEAASWFVRRGYVVVVPQRRGYGATGGRWDENYGPCDAPNFHGAGIEGARDVDTAVQYMRLQPFALSDRTLVVGQSGGGWAAVAYSAYNPAGVAAMVNFAGGRAGRSKNLPNTNCAPHSLVDTAGKFGSTARVPMLWIYTQNDTYFGPRLSQDMANAYRAAGGNVDYRLLPAFGKDGHSLFAAVDGVEIWSPLVHSFIAPYR